MKNKYKVASMFAGIGGICQGFKMAGADIVWANEIDKNACITYRENFGDSYLIEGDIHDVNTSIIPDFDILTSGFPCQAFSIAGYRKGFEDERGHLFFQTLRVIKDKKPRAFLIENVKNLVSHDSGKTFRIMHDELEYEGYHMRYQVLNSMEYGNVPQNRERIYLVGFLDKDECNNFYFPNPIELTNRISDITKVERNIDDKFYYKESSQYYEMLKEKITNYDSIYQLRRVYVRENKSGVCPTLTANMGMGGHNVPLLKDDRGIRKLTPRECLLLQGFPLDFKIPDKVSNSQIYKQAGNSVTVTVIKRIASNILEVLSDMDNKKSENMDNNIYASTGR